MDSPYSNAEFLDEMFALRNNSTLEPEEYVQMMKDVLRMNKNLCLCRRFSDLNKEFTK